MKKTNGINISEKFPYRAYEDDTIFSLENETFDIFSTFSGLKPKKCEIAG